MEAQQTSSNIDNDKCQKLKRFVIVGLLVAIGVLGYHFYEYFRHKPLPKAPNDVLTLSKDLYAEEMTQSPYLFKVNLQGRTNPGAYDDRAALPLFELHNDLLAMDDQSTTALLRRLFDNYEFEEGVADQLESEHVDEQDDFLRAVMNTRIMKLTMRFLVGKDIVSSDYDAQLQLLKELWFTPYARRNGITSSSSFEHVFMGELRGREMVLGLHNWIYIAEQEKQGNLNYKGWIHRLDMGSPQQFALVLRSTFHNVQKPYTSVLVGTSPELELSLYTVCFLTMPDKPCPVQLGKAHMSIMTYTWKLKDKKLIATAYVDIQ